MPADLTPEVLEQLRQRATDNRCGHSIEHFSTSVDSETLLALVAAARELARIRSVRHGGVATGELRALASSGEPTPEKWEETKWDGTLGRSGIRAGKPLVMSASFSRGRYGNTGPDAKYVVALHNAAPALFDALDAQEAEIVTAKEREGRLLLGLAQISVMRGPAGAMADAALAEVSDE